MECFFGKCIGEEPTDTGVIRTFAPRMEWTPFGILQIIMRLSCTWTPKFVICHVLCQFASRKWTSSPKNQIFQMKKRRRLWWEQSIQSVTYRILLKILSASWFFTIDVSPSFALDERKLIGGYAENPPVFAVYFFNAVNKITYPEAKRKWNVCCRPGFETWKDGKWMDVDIVDGITQKILKGKSADFSSSELDMSQTRKAEARSKLRTWRISSWRRCSRNDIAPSAFVLLIFRVERTGKELTDEICEG